jgi:tetratricopeptide (TPR) repeat protein
VVWSVAAGTLIAVVVSAGSLGWGLGDRAARRAAAREEVRLSLRESLALHRQGNTPAALTEARLARGLLAGLATDDPLRQRVAEMLTDLGLVARLERIRLGEPEDRGESGAAWGIEADYAGAFREYGVDFEALSAEGAGARLRGREVSAAVAAALDDWAAVCRRPPRPDDAKARHLLAVARAADPDEWRDRIRASLAGQDRAALKGLAADRRVHALSPATLVPLATILRRVGAAEEAVAVLRRAYARHPDDFWVNFQLAASLMKLAPPRAHEAARHYTAALVSRPESAAVYLNLGVALQDAGAIDEALAALERATALEPTFALAYNNLGNALARKGRREEAEAAFREAIRLRPNLHEAHYNLGSTLWDMGRPDEALQAFKAALAIKPDFAPAYAALAYRYRRLGRLDEAITAYRDFLRLEPGSAAGRSNLGTILLDRGRLAEAALLAKEAVGLQSDLAEASNLLGIALRAQGLLDEAIAAYQAAVRSRPRHAAAHCNLGVALSEAGRLDEALRAFQQALQHQPDLAEAHCGLGLVLLEQGQFGEALAPLRRGHALGGKRPGWPHPSGQWVADCERLVRLGPTVPAALRGEARVTSGVDLLALARLCSARKEDLAAARYFRDAFRAGPALAASPRTLTRYYAARAAARASLKGEGHPGWRRQALDWLCADLTFWEKQLAQDTERARGEVRLQLSRWQREPDFAGVRDPAALARLPEEERAAWDAFWGAVARLTGGPPSSRTHEQTASPGP